MAYKDSQIFIANNNSKDPVEHILDPFIARSVRIYSVSWVNFISGRFEFYISQILYGQRIFPDTLIRAVASDFKVTSSSVWDHGCSTFKAGYDKVVIGNNLVCAVWCPSISDKNQ